MFPGRASTWLLVMAGVESAAEFRQQFGRYLAVGALVAAIYVMGTFVLDRGGLPLPVAILAAYAAAILVHFFCQRYIVFAGERFHLSTRDQALRYALVGGLTLALTQMGTAILPRVGVAPFLAFLMTTGLVTAVGFVLLRRTVFHAEARGFQAPTASPGAGAP